MTIWANCPHCYTVAEIDIITTNLDTINCYTPYFYGYSSKPEAKSLLPLTSGKDIIAILSTEKEIKYIRDFYFGPNIGYMVCIDEVKTISISDSTVKAVILQGFIKDFNGACHFDTVSQTDYDYIKSHKFVSMLAWIGSCSDDYDVNFDPDVSPLEFVIILQCYTSSISFEKEPLLFQPGFNYTQPGFDFTYYPQNDILEYIESVPSILNYPGNDFYEKLESFIRLKKKRIKIMEKIQPKHKQLINTVIDSQNQFVKELDFLYEWYMDETVDVDKEKNSFRFNEQNESLEENFYSIVRKHDKKWPMQTSKLRNELKEFRYISYSKSWD